MWRQLLVVCALAVVGLTHSTYEENIEKALKHGLEHYINTGEISVEFQEVMKELQFPGLFAREPPRSLKNGLVCLACETGIGVLKAARKLGFSKEILVGAAVALCELANVVPKEFCEPTISHHADSFLYIFDNKKDLTSKRACSIILQSYNCKDDKREDWEIDIPDPVQRDDYPLNKAPSKSQSFKVLHVSDIHYDPYYEVGSNAACDGPVCCLPGSVPEKPEDAAGVWGDYRSCDAPDALVKNFFKHAVDKHSDVDYVYFTGDIVDHRVWGTGIEINSEVIVYITDLFKAHFGNKQVFPILGNHEPHPVNLFAEDISGEPLSTQWVFDLVADEWIGESLLPESTRETLLQGGFYTVLVKPGFRIIALNSNVCFAYNWWLILSDVDPYGQLQWLVEVLLEAERNGEAVHIISHVPTSHVKCLRNWASEYTRIVNRFSKTIVAQFNGHTHMDENLVYFNGDNHQEPINVAFNGGSITTYIDVNPNYIIYEVDSETYEVLDYDSWTFNLTEANLTPNIDPDWYKLYSFKEAYGVESLRPHDMAKWTEKLASSPQLSQEYFRYKHRESDTTQSEGCDDACVIENLCEVVRPYHGFDAHCERLKEIWESNAQKTLY